MSDFPLQVLKLYSALADLRTAEDWIHGTVDDLESLTKDVSCRIEHVAPEIVQLNWKTLISYQGDIQKRFVKQIKEKTEEINTLINGLIFTNQLIIKLLALSSSSVRTSCLG